MDGVQVATPPTKQSKLKQALKNTYVKTAILIIILIVGMLSFVFGVKAVFRAEDPFMAVVSGSMEPTLKVGDLIVVQGYADPSTVYAAPEDASPPGDIVVFWHCDSSRGLERWVHRAVEEFTYNGKRYVRTQGDHNSGPDEHYNLTTGVRIPSPDPSVPSGLPEEYVVGKVVANVPYIGQVALFMQTPEGRIIIIMLVVVLLIIEFIPFSRKKDEKQVLEQEQVKA